MAILFLNKEKLRNNYSYLSNLFDSRGIDWGIVTKLLSGNELFLNEILKLKPIQIFDSRIDSIKKIRLLDPHLKINYIRPPSSEIIDDILLYSDVSFNTELETIKEISRRATLKNKQHSIVLMIEMGDIREGINLQDIELYLREIKNLKNISFLGIGMNLYCISGILPTEEKFQKFIKIKSTLETNLQKHLSILSGGSSKSINFVINNTLPPGINNYRIGYALFFGKPSEVDPGIPGMEKNLFEIYAEIIEIKQKINTPDGDFGEKINYGGKSLEIGNYINNIPFETNYSTRAILDMGNSEAPYEYLTPIDDNIKIVGASSDMLVADIKNDILNYSLGRKIGFYMQYVAVRNAIQSHHVKKEIK